MFTDCTNIYSFNSLFEFIILPLENETRALQKNGSVARDGLHRDKQAEKARLPRSGQKRGPLDDRLYDGKGRRACRKHGIQNNTNGGAGAVRLESFG